MPPKFQTITRTPAIPKTGCWILHARAKEYHWEGSDLLSIKTFSGGRAHYRVGFGYHAVDDASYLVLNRGQTYTIDIQSRQPVESFCLFFAAGLVEDVQRAMTSPVEHLLDQPLASRAAVPHAPCAELVHFRHGCGTVPAVSSPPRERGSLPHPGWGASHPPPARASVPGKWTRMCDARAPILRRFVHTRPVRRDRHASRG